MCLMFIVGLGVLTVLKVSYYKGLRVKGLWV